MTANTESIKRDTTYEKLSKCLLLYIFLPYRKLKHQNTRPGLLKTVKIIESKGNLRNGPAKRSLRSCDNECHVLSWMGPGTEKTFAKTMEIRIG